MLCSSLASQETVETEAAPAPALISSQDLTAIMGQQAHCHHLSIMSRGFMSLKRVISGTSKYLHLLMSLLAAASSSVCRDVRTYVRPSVREKITSQDSQSG